MPAVIRGKIGGTRSLLVGRKSYATRYTLSSANYGSVNCQMRVVCTYYKGFKGKQVFGLKTMLEFLSHAVERHFPPITAIYLPTSK